MATKVQPTTERGGRKLSDDTRAKLAAAGRRTWERMTPEQQAAMRENLARGRAKIGAGAAPSTEPPPASNGGPRSPLDDAPGAAPSRPSATARLNGHATGAPPIFRVPDLPPLELGQPTDGLEGGSVDVADVGLAGGVTVTPEQVGEWLEFPFAFVALRRGDHWKLRPDERDMLAGPLSRKINEHAAVARGLSMGGDWLVIVGGLGVVIQARVVEDRERARDTAGAGDRPAAGGGAPSSAGGTRDVDSRPGDRGGPFGTLNGRRLGAPLAGGDEAAPAAAPPNALVQTFGG